MILLDTHVLLWWQEGGSRLSRMAAREISRADSIGVSPITFWEIATLLRTGRIRLDRDPYQWGRDLLEEPEIELVPMSVQIGLAAGLLRRPEFPGDPADRILYATARELVAPLITKDQAIRGFAKTSKDVKTIW